MRRVPRASSSCRSPPARRTGRDPAVRSPPPAGPARGRASRAATSGCPMSDRVLAGRAYPARSLWSQIGRSSPTIGGVTPTVPAALAATLKNLPDRPGVYLMKDARGDVLYVGKAQSLRSRVRSYWQKESPGGEIHRIRSVIDRVVDLEYTLTDSISEALLLEGNLIKRFQPQFNVRLKDDKSYPYIKITLGRRLPADRAHAQAAPGREPVLRAVRVGVQRGRGDEPRPAALPVPDLHDRHPRRGAGAPATVPAVPHQALPGPLHPGGDEGRVSRRRRAGGAVPRGPPGVARPGARRRDGPCLRAPGVRACGGDPGQGPGDRADDGEPEDGRLRQDGSRPRRPRPAGQPGRRPAVRDPRRQGDRARRLPAGGAAGHRRRGDPVRLPAPVLRAGHERPARGGRPAAASRRGRPGALPDRPPCGDVREAASGR